MKSNEIGTGFCVSFTMPPGGHVFLTINSVNTGVRELNGTSQMSLVTHNAKGEMREI